MDKQVEKNHYEFDSYSHEGRWVSYYWQLSKVLRESPKSVLEVGVGDKVFGSFLKQNTSVSYKSIDIAEDLNPDILGDVCNIPLDDNEFDAVCAFEVLEHLPFEKFETALKEMKRVARDKVIISLPHFGPPLQLSFKIPFIKRVQLSIKLPYHPQHEFNGQHYWEIGKRGYELKKIKKIFRKHFTLKEDLVPFNSQYHHFFVLEK